VEVAVKHAVARQEEELRTLVMKWEEAAVAIAKREEEIMEAVRNREAEVDAVCVQREELIKKRGRRTDPMGPREGERVESGGNAA